MAADASYRTFQRWLVSLHRLSSQWRGENFTALLFIKLNAGRLAGLPSGIPGIGLEIEGAVHTPRNPDGIPYVVLLRLTTG